jgi:peroxiredoxin
MNKNFTHLLGLAMATALVVGVSAQDLKVGASAPAFSGLASDGKTHSLETLMASGKASLIYFIGHECPVNGRAIKFYSQVAKGYEGKINFVGIIDTDKAGYTTWQNNFKATYPVIFDKDLALIKTFKAKRSPWSVLLDKKGNVVKEWPGYSVPDINDLSKTIAKTAGVKTVKIDTTGAPKETRYGCPFF